MRFIASILVLTAGAFPSAFAQSSPPFDLAFAGQGNMCAIAMDLRPYVSFAGGPMQVPTDIDFIAAAGSGRVYALVNPRAEIVELHPNLTRTPVFSGIDGVTGRSFVLDAAGNIYLAAAGGRLLAIRPDGSIRADFAVDARVMDLAADQCTLFYEPASSSNTIRRFDVCGGTPLPDFASGPDLRNPVVLPDGGLLAARLAEEGNAAILRYDSAGVLTRTYPMNAGIAQALALGRAGTSMLVGVSCRAEVREYNLASGALLRTVPIRSEFVDQIVAYGGFTAALGPLAAAHVAAVPSLSTIMLAVLGALLAVVAVRRV